MKNFIILFSISLSLFSCVSSRKFKDLNKSYEILKTESNNCNYERNKLRSDKSRLESEISGLNKQIDFLKENNGIVLKQLQELSVISSQQAESIKKSLDNIQGKDYYIKTLQEQINRKDSINMNLVINLKSVLNNVNDSDVNIKVEKGVVYVDISDKLLFESGKYSITENAKNILGKVALVLKNQPNIEFMVEGHTDDRPYNNPILLDNWDLSVKRATSVVRILQYQYGINPANMIAAGRGEYKPVVGNLNDELRSLNRRTRIIILPQLDQFFKLLEPSEK